MNSPIMRYFRQCGMLRRVGLLHGSFLYILDYDAQGLLRQPFGTLKLVDDKLIEAQAQGGIFVMLRRLPLSLVSYDEDGNRIEAPWSSIEMLHSVNGEWSGLNEVDIRKAFERDRRLKIITPIQLCRRFECGGYARWSDSQLIMKEPISAA